MSATWRFTDNEFYVLWRDLKEESLPRPLAYTSRTHSWIRHEQELAEIRQDLRGRQDPAFDGALSCIRDADIRVEVWGWSGRDRRDPDSSIRLLAARRAGRGFLVTQVPGETVIHARGFVVTEFDALDLGRLVTAALPDVDRGTRGDIVLSNPEDEDELDYSNGNSIVDRTGLQLVPAQSRAFLAAPYVRSGFIDIVQGSSVYGPRGITQHRLEWRDLEDDGRYVITSDVPQQALSSNSDRLTALINARIADVVRAIKDERGWPSHGG